MEAAADLIVDAAIRHLVQRQPHQRQQVLVELVLEVSWRRPAPRVMRSRNSRPIGCGNLGAGPKPPSTASNWLTSTICRRSQRLGR